MSLCMKGCRSNSGKGLSFISVAHQSFRHRHTHTQPHTTPTTHTHTHTHSQLCVPPQHTHTHTNTHTHTHQLPAQFDDHIVDMTANEIRKGYGQSAIHTNQKMTHI